MQHVSFSFSFSRAKKRRRRVRAWIEKEQTLQVGEGWGKERKVHPVRQRTAFGKMSGRNGRRFFSSLAPSPSLLLFLLARARLLRLSCFVKQKRKRLLHRLARDILGYVPQDVSYLLFNYINIITVLELLVLMAWRRFHVEPLIWSIQLVLRLIILLCRPLCE